MTNCTCHPGHTCTSVESCAAARRAEFGDVADYEKLIREALSDATQGHHSAIVSKADLRALLADLDAMRGALERIACIQNQMFGMDWEEIEDAREIARAALSEAKAGGWVAVQNKPVAYRVDWPVEAGAGMRRFYGADEWDSARGTVEFFGGIPTPLPAPPAQKDNT